MIQSHLYGSCLIEDDSHFLGVHIRLLTRCKICFTLGLFANFFSLKSLCVALNNLLAVNQFGLGVLDLALTQFTNVVQRNMDKGSVNDVVFNDLRNAFDAVDHVIMLRKLKTIGLTSTDLALFDSYLSLQCQKTVIGQALLLLGVSRCSSGIYSRSFISSISMICLTPSVTALSSYSLMIRPYPALRN